jgi:hypothetical protein
MGDKSPKSIARGQKQKKSARTQGAAAAKTKQDGQHSAPQTALQAKLQAKR